MPLYEPSSGGSSNSFATIDCPSGTDPVADSSTDTLALATANALLTITGDSTADSVTFAVVNSAIDHGTLAGLGDDDHNDATNGYVLREPNASVVDNTLVRWDSTTGRLIQESSVVLSDAEALSGLTQLDCDNIRLDGNTISTTSNGPIFQTPGTFTFTFQSDSANSDLTFTFAGTSNSGQLKWMEDEDYFEWNDGILLATAEELYFRATTQRIYSSSANVLDIDGPTLRLNPNNAGTIELGDSTLRVMRAATDARIDLGDSTHAFATQYVNFIFLKAGTSTGNTARVGGVININTTAVPNVGAGEDDLMTFSVPANTLSTNGMSIFGRCSGSIANTVNAKQLKLKFGATTILATGAAGITVSTAGTWVMTYEIIRTSSTAQKCNATFTSGGVVLSIGAYVTAAETLTGAVTLKVTGEAVANNDLIQETLSVHYGAYS